MTMPIVNIAAYRFVRLTDLPVWKERLEMKTQTLGLRGTILLAHEGINLFLAGTEEAIDSFVNWLKGLEQFADIEIKFSRSEFVPFKRMKVKIKNEIIRMIHPSIHPYEGRAPSVDAKTALRWIEQGKDDEGNPIVLLDTRNEFEVQAGTFKGAQHWGLKKFTEFPSALQSH